MGTSSENGLFTVVSGLEASDILAFFALLISILAIVLECWRWARERKTSLELEYYKFIFDKFLVEEKKKKREYVFYSPQGGLDKSYKEFCKCLSDLKKKALFFKYHRSGFYRDLCGLLEEMDEILVIEGGKKQVGTEEQSRFLFELDSKIMNLYETIFRNSLM